MTPLETYLHSIWEIRSTRGGKKETSYYGPLESLFNDIGKDLRPKVRCLSQLKDLGAGSPDFGFFTMRQMKMKSDSEPLDDQLPDRGVIEAKPTSDDAWFTSKTEQVSKYWKRYGTVLVTNYRDFLVIGKDEEGKPKKFESFRLAESEKEFWELAKHPARVREGIAKRFEEFGIRVMLHGAPLEKPEDVAWFLASYARDAKARIEGVKLPALDSVRQALEQALGVRFEGEKGDQFFRSTLVQTLFYGMFSAWVLWSQGGSKRKSSDRFDWKTAAWTLRVPMIRALFDQIAAPSKLLSLGIVEPLDWAAESLNKVNRDAFFSLFDEGHAVQYFYEPFLQRFDPELQKEYGVWYTPPEIVTYMVARVDQVLKEDLGILDGLADPRVYVLDPCCGTGAFLVEVLRRIESASREKNGDALVAQDVKRAALDRVFGFEIMPAPFVIAHLQLGLMLNNLHAPLNVESDERAAVYLTNALTGWSPPKEPKQHLIFAELEQERDAAQAIKQNKPILVVLGNPPYNGFADVAVEEERELSEAYRVANKVAQPRGQGLNDLYVRFFSMAERRIVGKSGEGVVCYISNYSWLEGLSFTGMRERYLTEFDKLYIDCLNGDRYKTGKVTPDGLPDPSVFSTPDHPVGIQVGTSIATLIRKRKHKPTTDILFRDFWGATKRQQLLDAVKHGASSDYVSIKPAAETGLSFSKEKFSPSYFEWPDLSDIYRFSTPGIKTSRDPFLVSIDRDDLEARIADYFDESVSTEEMGRTSAVAVKDAVRFKAAETRATLQKRGRGPGRILKYCYRPFDVRWLYWDPDTKLLDEKRAEALPHVFAGNLWMVAAQQNRKAFDPPFVSPHLCSLHLIERGANLFPLYVRASQERATLFNPEPGTPTLNDSNSSNPARSYVDSVGSPVTSLFFHAIAVLYSPRYRTENESPLRRDWPRVPLPNTKRALEESAQFGQLIANLLDNDSRVGGVTAGTLRDEIRGIGIPSRVDGKSLKPERGDLDVSAGWGHAGKEGVTMPGKGRIVEREYTKEERDAIKQGAKALGLSLDVALAELGSTTCDVYLNDVAFWKNVPKNVWEYVIGGYQVVKKWLSYREYELLGRGLTPDEVREVQDMCRRIAAILLLQPALNANYEAIKKDCFDWSNVSKS